MNDSMRLMDLLVCGVRRARQAKRWAQEDTARAFRQQGLKAWRRGSVGQLESGGRFPRLGELLVMCAALDVPLNELIATPDCDIEVCSGVTMPGAAIRALLSGERAGLGELPPKPEPPTGAECDIANKLGVHRAVVAEAARTLWGRSLDAERDARAGDLSSLSPRSRQARRGLAARPLVAELKTALHAKDADGKLGA